MAKGHGHGKENLSVDGGRAQIVDTVAANTREKVIVWQQTLNVGTHTVKVTNAGTKGRSRVDIDSVLVMIGSRARSATSKRATSIPSSRRAWSRDLAVAWASISRRRLR